MWSDTEQLRQEGYEREVLGGIAWDPPLALREVGQMLSAHLFSGANQRVYEALLRIGREEITYKNVAREVASIMGVDWREEYASDAEGRIVTWGEHLMGLLVTGAGIGPHRLDEKVRRMIVGWQLLRKRETYIQANGHDPLVTKDEIDEKLRGIDEIAQRAASSIHVNESDAETFDGMQPPEYLFEGFLLRHYVYALTGVNGHGKTTIAVRFAVALAHGLGIGRHRCQPGRVLYMAGENKDDFCYKLAALAEREGLSDSGVKTITVAGSLADFIPVVQAYAKRCGGLDLIIVDTKRAYSLAKAEENDNDDAMRTARVCRALSETVAGKPTVLTLSHPNKAARNMGPEDCVPAGGGAFLGEIDGNLTCVKDADGVVAIARHCDKFRGAWFEPLKFELKEIKAQVLHGMPAPVAMLLSDSQIGDIEQRHSDDQVAILIWLEANGPATQRICCGGLGWRTPEGEIEEMRLSRALKPLKEQKLVAKKAAQGIEITPKGKGILDAILKQRMAREAAAARYVD